MDEANKQLVTIASNLEEEYPSEKDLWENSPFRWIARLSSENITTVGKQLSAAYCSEQGLHVEESVDAAEADLLVEGRRAVVKFSVLWPAGVYIFQQYGEQNYEFVFCLGISQQDAHAWIFPRAHIPYDEIAREHGGPPNPANWWVRFPPASPPQWMQAQSGKLSDVCDVFRRYMSEEE